MTAPTGSLPPDEAAFYAAWLGKLWPRYRSLFDGTSPLRRFEWRPALYPIWLAIPGLYPQLAGVIALVVLACLSLILVADVPDVAAALTIGIGLITLWPLAWLAWLILSTGQDAPFLFMLLPLGMLALSLAMGMRAPRWIVAEGRRRWTRHVARVAAGETPAVPKAITTFRPALLAVLLAIVAVPLGLMVFLPSHDDQDIMLTMDMRSDLRNLATAEEEYFADSVRYTRTLPAGRHTPSEGVMVDIVSADPFGWAAVARHAQSRTTCSIFVGTAASPIEGGSEAQPVCTRRRVNPNK